MLLVALLGWGCDTEGELAPTSSPGHAATSSPRPSNGVEGGVATSDVVVQPTPTPSAASLLPTVQRVELSPLEATVSLNPNDTSGNPTGTPGSVWLQAYVVYGDLTHNDMVTWRSLNPGLVEVSSQGVVKPATPIGAPLTGTGSVVAASEIDPSVTATCTVTVVP